MEATTQHATQESTPTPATESDSRRAPGARCKTLLVVPLLIVAAALVMTACGPTGRTQGATTATNPVWNPDYIGQCTWGAQEEWHQATGSYMVVEGDAWNWAGSAASHGWTVTPTPSTRSMVVFPRGVAGADTTTGHVAWVNAVNQRTDGTYIDVTEMHWTNGRYNWDQRTLKNEPGLTYILAP